MAAFPNIRSYIGVPILLADGTFFGTLCGVDPEPRPLTREQVELMCVFARFFATEIDREREREQRQAAEAQLTAALAAQWDANEQQRRRNREQAEFVSVVSHEFQTPLSGIQGFSELIRDADLGIDEIKEFAADINRDAHRLGRMVNEILNLNRLESGRVTLERDPVDVNAVLSEVVGRLRASAPRHRIAVALDPGLPPVRGDRDKLVQVATNLLANAIKYSPRGGEIVVGSERDGAMAHIWVRDEGVGIPKEAMESVFERYVRLDAETTHGIQGTGLGLPIARQIVELHGGNIWAASAPGNGSTFHFTIPIAQ